MLNFFATNSSKILLARILPSGGVLPEPRAQFLSIGNQNSGSLQLEFRANSAVLDPTYLKDGYLSGRTKASNPLEVRLLWLAYSTYFVEVFPYSYIMLPWQFFEVRKPKILAFTDFQVLRFIFNIPPQLIPDFPTLILRPIQCPCRYLL